VSGLYHRVSPGRKRQGGASTTRVAIADLGAIGRALARKLAAAKAQAWLEGQTGNVVRADCTASRSRGSLALIRQSQPTRISMAVG
jgi:hypothetical protein